MCNKLRGSIVGGVFLLLAGASWAATPPPNDNFANRIVLTGHSLTFTGITAGATYEPPTEAWWATGGPSVWWSWTATETAPVTLEILRASKGRTNYFADVLSVWHSLDLTLGFPTNILGDRVLKGKVLDPWLMHSSGTFTGIVGETYQIKLSSMIGTEYVIALTTTNIPVIMEQPKSQTVSEGASALLTVAATGILPLSYQWRFNDIDLPGGDLSYVDL